MRGGQANFALLTIFTFFECCLFRVLPIESAAWPRGVRTDRHRGEGKQGESKWGKGKRGKGMRGEGKRRECKGYKGEQGQGPAKARASIGEGKQGRERARARVSKGELGKRQARARPSKGEGKQG